MSKSIEIKFWDKTTNTMIYPIDNYESICIVDGYMKPVLNDSVDGNWCWYKREYIPLLYVGFKDRNGKKIHEGDIDSSGYVVTYLADLNGGYGMTAGWYLQRDNFESWSELECDENIEVVGNIFENPEKAINNCNIDYSKMF